LYANQVDFYKETETHKFYAIMKRNVKTSPFSSWFADERSFFRPPLMWLSLSFLAGILIAQRAHAPLPIWLALFGFQLLIALLTRRVGGATRLSWLALMVLTLLFGAIRYQTEQAPITPGNVAFYNDADYEVLVTGWLIEPPDYRDRFTNLRLRVETVDSGNGELPRYGLILARVAPNQTFHYGDMLRLRGRLKTPPADEEFSYRDYLARQGIFSYMPIAEATLLPDQRGNPLAKAIYAFKEKSLENIYRLFPDPEASLLAGILLGIDTGLTPQLQEAFKNTGTAHIIAISGFNISIIAAIFIALFARLFGQRTGNILAILGIALYTFLVGADAAVVRAALMGTLSILARQLGRRQLALNTLTFVAAIMALFNPLILWDVGFQLSFFATLGLILYGEPLSRLAENLLKRYTTPEITHALSGPIADFFLLTLAAQLTTLPIMAYHFKRISLISFVANPFILPVQPAVMIIGGLATLLSHLWFGLGQIVAWGAWPFVAYTIRIVEWFDRIPNGSLFLGNLTLGFVLLYYAALLGGTLGWSRLKELLTRLRARFTYLPATTILIVLFALTLLIWRAVFSLPDRQMHITFLDVGSAEAILIQTPGGRTVLINGGPSVTRLSDHLGRRLPLFTRNLDWLVIAATSEEQVAALPRLLDRYPPRNVLWTGRINASFSARQLNAGLVERQIPVTRAAAGQSLNLGDGAVLRIQAEGPRGSVLYLEYKNFRALLPIGVDPEILETMRRDKAFGTVNVLLLPDSGYAPSNPPDWIASLAPQLLILDVAADDPDGLPSPETLEAVADYNLLRTDYYGWIAITTDGTQMKVETARRPLPTPTPAENTP
jgi:competence protein ComEC